jgi:hypothetical protein
MIRGKGTLEYAYGRREVGREREDDGGGGLRELYREGKEGGG